MSSSGTAKNERFSSWGKSRPTVMGRTHPRLHLRWSTRAKATTFVFVEENFVDGYKLFVTGSNWG
jgi:hypothetical protein